MVNWWSTSDLDIFVVPDVHHAQSVLRLVSTSCSLLSEEGSCHSRQYWTQLQYSTVQYSTVQYSRAVTVVNTGHNCSLTLSPQLQKAWCLLTNYLLFLFKTDNKVTSQPAAGILTTNTFLNYLTRNFKCKDENSRHDLLLLLQLCKKCRYEV